MTAAQAVETVARDTTYHAVREYLSRLEQSPPGHMACHLHGKRADAIQ